MPEGVNQGRNNGQARECEQHAFADPILGGFEAQGPVLGRGRLVAGNLRLRVIDLARETMERTRREQEGRDVEGMCHTKFVDAANLVLSGENGMTLNLLR
jgi:hypothetical protein